MATVDDTISPRGSASVEDGRSLHSAASTSAWESVDGHDDATAPITNCTKAKASEIPDCGTIDSFVTQSLIADGSTDDRDDEKSNKELSPSLSISRDLKDQLNELDKRWHELEAKLPPTLSPSQNDKEASSPFESINEDAPTAEANESHQQPHSGNVNDTESPNSQMVATGTATSEIVRQVQKRLLSESNSSIGQQGLSQAFWTVNVDDLEGGQVDKPSETAKTLNSIESTTTWKLNLDDVEEVVEFEQTSTAGNTINSSGDEQSSQDNCKTTRQRSRWCFILIVILLLIAVILAIVFGTKEDSKSAPLDSNGSKGDQTLSPTDSPTVNPTAKPTIATMAPTTPPTANPTTKPTPSPTANPTTKPTSKPSSSLKPSYSDPVFNHLYSLSGDLLLDENTPQFKTYEWLLQDDPAYLNLLEIPLKDLEQRYVAALLYFSLNGDSWHTDFGFLGESPVCEWNNDSGEGIKCDSSRTIVGVTISKYIVQFFVCEVCIPILFVTSCFQITTT
jgi:cytoskeletal protein RodZ